MHEPDTEAINAATRPDIGYEYRDLNIKGILVSTFWFFFGTGICIVLTLIGLRMAVELPLRATTMPETIPAAPNPLLQGTMATKADIAHLKRDEDRKVNTYGWLDKAKGVAHMPVDKAIDLIAERGLKSEPAADVPPRGEGL